MSQVVLTVFKLLIDDPFDSQKINLDKFLRIEYENKVTISD